MNEPNLKPLLAVTNKSGSVYYFIEEEVFDGADLFDELEFLELDSSIIDNEKHFKLSRPFKRVKCFKHEFSGIMGT